MAEIKETPMMAQYHKIKAEYPDVFLFYRLGDFYELFEEDAIKGAQILELTLTTRDKKNKTPMAGIPHHAAQNYIDILVEQGYKVAIVEQLEDPKTTKGMVDRGVVQLITPGTKLMDSSVHQKDNNFLVSVNKDAEMFQLAYIDLSTGELNSTSLEDLNELVDEIISLEAKEVVVTPNIDIKTIDLLAKKEILVSHQNNLDSQYDKEYLTEQVSIKEKENINYLLAYLLNTQKQDLQHIKMANHYEKKSYLKLDENARANLDLIRNMRTGKKEGSLLDLVDKTKTAMGARLLKQWIIKPIRDITEIKKRQDAIKTFINDFIIRNDIQEHLKKVYDLERLSTRAALGHINAREMANLKKSLQAVPEIIALLNELPNESSLKTLAKEIDACLDLADLIEKSIAEDAPLSIREGNIIKTGFDEKIDEYRSVLSDSQTWLLNLQTKEREATGINNLKVAYNKNFGYYIEITKGQLAKLPENRYERKQTLTNAERFVTAELKEREKLILEAENKLTNLEYERFIEIRAKIKDEIRRIQKLAEQIARIDLLSSLADLAEENQYVCPNFNVTDNIIDIKDARHPVVEKLVEFDQFVSNDINLNQHTTIQMITGPNMAGKSTYMKSLALIIIMAQMGSYVPASFANIPIFDRLFTRIGASDDLVSGQSTFMVEMAEANKALQNASANSLVILDELGRGTATYDGMALAQSIVEYIDNKIHAKTLFATHYHELTSLAKKSSSIQNVHVGAVEQEDGTLVFLHKIKSGPADKSYGIHVAALAGLPISVVKRANDILVDLENTPKKAEKTTIQAEVEQIDLFMDAEKENLDELKMLGEELEKLDVNKLTPLEALNMLAELKSKYQGN